MEREIIIKSEIGGVKVHVEEFEDNSKLLRIEERGKYEPHVSASAPLAEKQARRVARALSPLYVVKSSSGNYASYDIIAEGSQHGLLSKLSWTEDRTLAAHFTSKRAANALAGAYPNAGPRVVRLR